LLSRGYNEGDSIKELQPAHIEGSWGWQIVDEVAPLANEVVIKKRRFSSFFNTNLDAILRSNGIQSLVIVGVVTNGCVLATANDATALGYYPILLTDCIASERLELHNAALLIMSNTKDLIDSKKVLEVWERGDLAEERNGTQRGYERVE